MTDIEKQDIIDSVVSFLKKDSLTIDQLVNTDVLNSEDMIELNKGRKVSLEVLKDFIRGYGIYLEIIGKNDGTLPSDNNVFSAVRTLQEILRNSEKLKKIFLRKDQSDGTSFLLKLLGGAEFGKYVSGALGTGGAVTIDQDGNSHAEFDYLTIRKVALFIELIIQEAKSVGGMLVVSPSGMTVSKVEETSTAYRCYFERTDGDRTLQNQFTVGTQARRQTFNLTSQAYYWRLVTAVGDDYVDLSKTDCDTGSTIPQAGDELVGLGHRTDKHGSRLSLSLPLVLIHLL